MLPNNIPNTSQIVADPGSLPNVQIHYTIPADEKQIVASLRTLQRDLNEAMQTINSLTRERDEALLELRMLRTASKKPSTPAKKGRATATRVDEELFDLSRSMESPKRPSGRPTSRHLPTETQQAAKTANSDDARVLSPVPVNRPATPPTEKRTTNRPKQNPPNTAPKRPAVNDTENSVMEDPTAASNTSRRRRHLSLDENMTSAYILPDITVNQPAKQQAKLHVSHEAQSVLHRHDPEHVENCAVCQRLTTKKTRHSSHHATHATEKTDFTAQITRLMRDAMLDEPTIRPKISPWLALANVKKLLTDQFEEAKLKHSQAWEKYDAIEAPSNSKRHAASSRDLFHWSKKMEECRINLDQLRDVEEGMREQDEA
jgi:hypothetical protein